MRKEAKFYGIGTGPGDSSLLTIKAVDTFKILDILYAPEAKKGGESLALSIVRKYLPKNLEIKTRYFPMSEDDRHKQKLWETVVKEIESDVNSNKNVGFVTLGDPMIYSTYVYIMERLKKDIEVVTIPGISSFSCIASTNNFPLVMDKNELIVIPCTIEEERLDYVLERYNSIVLMKVYRNLEMIIKKLHKNKLIDKAILVCNSSQEDEVIYRNLREIDLKEKVSYFSTILINKRID